LGRYIKSDNKLPGYMRVRVDYPLKKPLLPKMKVKIKGRGMMNIILRYENVCHLCFHCARMGHAAVNCGEHEAEEMGIHYGEELRASPPHRAREIVVQQATTGVVCQLFQAEGLGMPTPN
jgi:hypothetical protein